MFVTDDFHIVQHSACNAILFHYSSSVKKKQPAPRGRPHNETKVKFASDNSCADPDYIPVKRGRGRPRKNFPKPEDDRFVISK